jgi:RNA polymerase sigma factor (sigma-70 family)
MDSLTTLVIAAQRGDLDAFGEIVIRFQDMAYAGAYAWLGDFHLAQEAFIDAYLSLPNLREPAAFPGWFRKIILKHGDRISRRKQVATVPIETTSQVSSTEADPAVAVEVRQMKQTIYNILEALPEHQRLVTTLFYITGYSQKEIADFLDVPVSTVKKRLYDARKRLQERMEILMTEYLQANRPSQDEQFSNTIQLFLALQIGDGARVERLLEKDPALVHAKCEFHADLAREMLYWPTGNLPLE